MFGPEFVTRPKIFSTPRAALAQSDIAYSYGLVAAGSYASEAADQQMIVVRR
jgi:hypothetical protein